MRHLAGNQKNAIKIAEENVITPLILLLRKKGSSEEKTETAGALGNLAANAGIAGDVVRLGGLYSLMLLVSEGSAESKKMASKAL